MSFSLSWLRREREELRRDRAAFATSLDILRRRLLESNECEIPRTPPLHQWSGSRACIGSLEMAFNAIERTLDEIEAHIVGIENGEIPDLDMPPVVTPGGSN